MDLTFKKSHVYASVLFCMLACGLTCTCLARAATHKMPWADVPGTALLLILASGLLSIALNFGWLLVRERLLGREEPRNYPVTNDTLYAAATLMLFSTVLGLSQG